ncbi:MAG TPA: DUF177 domain-containing protein [Zeimonas sp.]|nr:DUF177 domain-containing protein [Zeimonas sp.]
MANTIDTARLARSGQTLSGELEVEGLPRLASLLASPQGRIEWTLRGWRHARPEGGSDEFMELSFSASLHPACVRCLQPVEVSVGDTRRYRLVASEDEAERLDPEDDEYDVLAGGTRFDLGALIEDEAILALPPMPRHEGCEPARALREEVPEAEAPEKPLAGLRRLRRNGPAGGDETPQ